MAKKLFESKGTGERILKLLKSDKEYGGPQSIDDVCRNLIMTNRNTRSMLSKMTKNELIDRIDDGIYRIKGDSREYNKDKPHYGYE